MAESERIIQSSAGRSTRIATVPNFISAARLLLALALPFVALHWRLPLFLIGAVSDWVDGLWAHLTRTRTVVGQVLDPVADKALTLSALLTLVLAHEVHWWQVAMALLRELVVVMAVGLAVVLREWSGFSRMPPMLIGKITTVLVFLWIVSELLDREWIAPARLPLFIMTAISSVLCAAAYMHRLIRELRALMARRRSIA